MKVAVVITARMKSRRLSRKALLEINGRTVIEHLIDRIKLSKLPDMIVLCTSTYDEDNVLCEIAEKNGIDFFRGSPEDKLQRYLDASNKFGFDHMIDVSADNVFSDYECIDSIIQEFDKNDADVVMFKDLPLGVSPIGLKMDAVERVCKMKNENDTEAYGPYFFNSIIFKVSYLKTNISRPDIRLTIDYQEDFDLAKEIFIQLGEKRNTFSLKSIVELFERNPKLLDINKDAQKKYEENFKNLKKPSVKSEYRSKFNF